MPDLSTRRGRAKLIALYSAAAVPFWLLGGWLAWELLT